MVGLWNNQLRWDSAEGTAQISSAPLGCASGMRVGVVLTGKLRQNPVLGDPTEYAVAVSTGVAIRDHGR